MEEDVNACLLIKRECDGTTNADATGRGTEISLMILPPKSRPRLIVEMSIMKQH